MFGKEQPDVVTEEEVGEYIEQLKKDGLVELDYEDAEQRVAVLPKRDKLLKGAGYAIMYGSSGRMVHTKTPYGKSLVEEMQGDLDELARLSEDSTSGTQVKK